VKVLVIEDGLMTAVVVLIVSQSKILSNAIDQFPVPIVLHALRALIVIVARIASTVQISIENNFASIMFNILKKNLN
jgi:hypothetical protein